MNIEVGVEFYLVSRLVLAGRNLNKTKLVAWGRRHCNLSHTKKNECGCKGTSRGETNVRDGPYHGDKRPSAPTGGEWKKEKSKQEKRGKNVKV